MDWEKASFFLGIAVLAMQAWNLYISNSLKLWAMEKFVSKEDLPALCPARQHEDRRHA